jgi:hypothetical protein
MFANNSVNASASEAHASGDRNGGAGVLVFSLAEEGQALLANVINDSFFDGNTVNARATVSNFMTHNGGGGTFYSF